MTAAPDSRHNDADPLVTFRIDPDAEPGDASPALARLLIGIDRRRRERDAAELSGDPTHRGTCPYPSMPVDDIMAMPVQDRTCENAILWLWTTNAFMVQAHNVAVAWGFTVKTILTWVKNKIGTGDWLRGQTEHCLMCVRGKPVVELTNQTTVLHGPLREHSRKPDEFYAMVETLCPGSKCDLFSRQERTGWVSFGAEVGMFPAAATRQTRMSNAGNDWPDEAKTAAGFTRI
jgi:N6-adenosine-specific RNA methylase IME4